MIYFFYLSHKISNKLLHQAKTNSIRYEEVYRILKKALFPKDKQKNLGSRLYEQIMEITKGIELELLARSLPRKAPDFENTK